MIVCFMPRMMHRVNRDGMKKSTGKQKKKKKEKKKKKKRKKKKKIDGRAERKKPA